MHIVQSEFGLFRFPYHGLFKGGGCDFGLRHFNESDRIGCVASSLGAETIPSNISITKLQELFRTI